MGPEQNGFPSLLCATGGGPGIVGETEVLAKYLADVVLVLESLCRLRSLNSYVTPELGFEFHYFFTRKYWFLYLCKLWSSARVVLEPWMGFLKL